MHTGVRSKSTGVQYAEDHGWNCLFRENWSYWCSQKYHRDSGHLLVFRWVWLSKILLLLRQKIKNHRPYSLKPLVKRDSPAFLRVKVNLQFVRAPNRPVEVVLYRPCECLKVHGGFAFLSHTRSPPLVCSAPLQLADGCGPEESARSSG